MLFWRILHIYLILLLVPRMVNPSELTYYEILEVEKHATAQEIRQAYKKLAIKFHPDKNPGASEQEKFIKLTEAYETLKDPEKRHKYDLYGTFSTYTRNYDSRSQAEYNRMFYQGLYADDEYVETLTPKTFDNFLSEGFSFINFYSPFCPPCQSLSEHWKKLAKKYHGIVKVGAVNCKYHNAFCYNNMRIHSYPTLIFYPDDKHSYLYYRQERTIEAMDRFVMSYLQRRLSVPSIAKLRDHSKQCIVYIIGRSWFDIEAITRIAYHLKGVSSVYMVEDDELRNSLTTDESTTAVVRCGDRSRQLSTQDETELVREVVDSLPNLQRVDADEFQWIRKSLRIGGDDGWVFYMTHGETDNLLVHKLRAAFPHLNFGEIDCLTEQQLCYTLHVTSPTWSVLKPGGAYQQAVSPTTRDQLAQFIRTAMQATSLHTLSDSDYDRIVHSDMSAWIICVIPARTSWEHVRDMFLEAAVQLTHENNIQFGILSCNEDTSAACERVSRQAAVVVRVRGRQHEYRGTVHAQHLLTYIRTLTDTSVEDLSDREILEILDADGRDSAWLVAFIPEHCGEVCDALSYHWKIVGKKLRPLPGVSVGEVRCRDGVRFCHNVRTPTIKLYLPHSSQHYVVSMQQLSEAVYMLEWALPLLYGDLQTLTHHTFHTKVIQQQHRSRPWLVYFHSPRCYHCYEMLADFVIAGVLLKSQVQIGKINCLNERELCRQERVTRYPSMILYGRGTVRGEQAVIPVTDYNTIMQHVHSYLIVNSDTLLMDDRINIIPGVQVSRDEL